MDSLPGFGEGKDNWTLRYKRPELSAKAKSSPPGLYRPWLADLGWEQGIETSPPRLCQPGRPHYYSFLSKRGFYFCCKALDAFQSPDSSPLEGCWDFIFYSGSSRMLGGWGWGGHPDARSQRQALPQSYQRRTQHSGGLWVRCWDVHTVCRAWRSKGYSIQPVLTRTGTHASQVGTF